MHKQYSMITQFLGKVLSTYNCVRYDVTTTHLFSVSRVSTLLFNRKFSVVNCFTLKVQILYVI